VKRSGAKAVKQTGHGRKQGWGGQTKVGMNEANAKGPPKEIPDEGGKKISWEGKRGVGTRKS